MAHGKSTVVLVFLAVFWGALSITAPCRARAQERRPVKLVIAPYISYGPFFIAREEGFFAEQGLEVEFVRFTQSSMALPALIKGDVDVLCGIIYPSHFNAMARGVPFRMVADKGRIAQNDCTEVIMIRPDMATDDMSIADLKGKRFALNSATSPADYIMDRLLRQSGLGLKDVEQVHLYSPARLDGFATGAIDVSVMAEPYATLFEESGHAVNWKYANEAVSDMQYTVMYYGINFLQKDRDAGKRFMVAYLQGVRQFLHGKTERNVFILAKYTDLEPEMLRRVCWTGIDSNGEINLDSVLDQQAWFLKQGFLDTPAPAGHVYDPSFVEHAVDILGAR